jgi:DNA polymerase V
MPKLFALLDCNNFFVSCERVFNPGLRGKPVVVLSNNDGCVVARSNEAKAVGIGMGEPLFKCQDLIKRNKVFVYSANFCLYGDLSGRVMQTAAEFTDDLEIYSIDEAFLSLEGIRDPYDHALLIRNTIHKDTGMPVSMGIAATKTLAKVANRIAKKQGLPVFCLTTQEIIDRELKNTEVEDIWGIGHQKSDFLKRQGIYNAFQLKSMPDSWIKDNLTVISLKTVWELRGTACLESQDNRDDKKAITTSRTFGKEVRTLEELETAVAAYIANAAEKLREQSSICGYLQVYVTTNRFKDGYYGNSAGMHLLPATAYTPDLIASAKKVLKSIYRSGYSYKKVGVILSHLQPQDADQKLLFDQTYFQSSKHKLMQVVDAINATTNRGKIFTAAEGLDQWKWYNQSFQSKRFTTRWDELLEIKI